MTDLKDSTTRSASAAPSGLSNKPEANSTLPTASPALSAAPYQGGYLSKLFGLGSGTGPSTFERPTGAMDEAHEYHPGISAVRAVDCSCLPQTQLGFLPYLDILCRTGFLSNRRWYLGNPLW